MKTWKKAGIFVCIAVFTQLIVLFYLNDNMLISHSVFNPEEIKSEDEIKILIPDNIKELKPSYDGKFCSYYNDDSLYIIDTHTGMRKKMEFKDGENLNVYKWYNNENKMILAEQAQVNNAGRLRITLYDAEQGKKEDIKDLSWLGNNVRIEDIDFTAENDIVVKITQSDGRSDLYHVGLEVIKLPTVSRNIGGVRYIGEDNKVLYQDKTTKKYYITGEKKELELKTLASNVVGLDSSGNIYIFERDEEGKSFIHYRYVYQDKSEWNTIELYQDIEYKNVFIAGDGSVYIDNALEGKFTEVKSKVSINYEGRLMAFFKGGVFTHKNEILEKIEFKDLVNK